MRVAVVTDSVAPWHIGGKERWQHEIFRRLAADGVEVDAYTMAWWGRGPTEVDGIRFHAVSPKLNLYAGGRRSIVQALVFSLLCIRMMFRRFDVMHVDSIPFFPLFVTRVVCRIRRRPMVVMVHEFWGSEYWIDYLGRIGRIAALVELSAISPRDRVIAASEGTRERLLAAHRSLRNVQVVTPGIDVVHCDALRVADAGPSEADESDAGEPGADQSRPTRLVYAGRLINHKHVDEIVRACAMLRGDGMDTRLDIVGTGPMYDELASSVERLGLSAAIRFHGALDEHDDVLRLIAAADVLVFPSVREGFGMVALEALALGVPVITTPHPDNFARYLVSHGVTGLLAEPTADQLADAVRGCVAALASFSTAARASAERYDWAIRADEITALYAAAAA